MSSQIGYFLGEKLEDSGIDLVCTSRCEQKSRPGCRFIRFDLSKDDPQTIRDVISDCDGLLSIAPIWNSLRLLPQFVDRRAVFIGSTSQFTKAGSSSSQERALAQRIRESQDAVIQSGTRYTILHPTLVYGTYQDRNIFTMIRFIERFGFFVLPPTTGMKQPIFAGDIADAVLACLKTPATIGKTYILSGKEPIDTEKMVKAIFRFLGKRPRIFRLSPRILQWGVGLMGLDPAMIERMQENIVYGHEEASRTFGFTPMTFETGLKAYRRASAHPDR